MPVTYVQDEGANRGRLKLNAGAGGGYEVDISPELGMFVAGLDDLQSEKMLQLLSSEPEVLKKLEKAMAK